MQVLRPAPQGPGHRGPASLHQLLCLPAQGVLGRGVAELIRQTSYMASATGRGTGVVAA